VLSERGDIEPIQRNPSFRLLAAMNPANDVGKKDLPPALRNRFTEFVLRDLSNKEDLQLLVTKYLSVRTPNPPAPPAPAPAPHPPPPPQSCDTLLICSFFSLSIPRRLQWTLSSCI